MLAAFTLFHVVLSLIGIGAGFVFLAGLLSSKSNEGWTNLFLYTTIATSVTGFMFPVEHITPGHVLGVLSLIVLAIAIVARRRHLAGGWRRAYVITTVTALYFNCFVLVAQMFQKIPALHALAPTQSEPPFGIAQLGLLLIFITLGTRAAMKFRLGTTLTA